METKPRRKGAMRIADIPPDVLRALNEGREETITLVEWLAIDMPTLLRSILPSVGLPEAGNELGRVADGLAGEGVTVRLKSIATALFEATQRHPGRAEVFEAMASHASDMVRACLQLSTCKFLPPFAGGEFIVSLILAPNCHSGPHPLSFWNGVALHGIWHISTN